MKTETVAKRSKHEVLSHQAWWGVRCEHLESVIFAALVQLADSPRAIPVFHDGDKPHHLRMITLSGIKCELANSDARTHAPGEHVWAVFLHVRRSHDVRVGERTVENPIPTALKAEIEKLLGVTLT